MKNPKDIQSQKVSEVLEQLHLSGDMLEKAEEYLLGNGGEECLEQFDFQDLSAVPSDKAVRLFRDYMRKGKREELNRLFRLLFAVGQSTCYQLVPLELVRQGDVLWDEDKCTAVYGTHIGMSQYCLNSYNLNGLMAVAKNRPENLEKAIGYQKNDAENGKLVLLAVYFVVKYGDVHVSGENGKKEEIADGKENGEGEKAERPVRRNLGFIDGIGKFFRKKEEARQPEALVDIDAGDMPLMAQYEELILNSLDNLYENQMDASSLQKLMDAVRKNRMTEDIFRLAASKRNVSDFLFLLLGGMAYLNFLLSVKLKNAVRIFLAIDTEKMLNVMVKVSEQLPAVILSKGEGETANKLFPVNIHVGGGEYDEVFGIDTERYIRWAAAKDQRVILKKQLENHEECYIKIMDEVTMEDANAMLEVIRTTDKPLFDKLMAHKRQYGRDKERERMLNALAESEDASVREVIKAYLRGEEKVDVLYPFLNQIRNKYYYNLGRAKDIVEKYAKNLQDEEFLRRCRVYMLLKNTYYLQDYVIVSGTQGVNRGKLEEIFRNFDSEGLAVSYQLAALVWLHDAFYNDRYKREALEEAEHIFAGYLKERREETLAAFLSAEAVGRFFGLRVMSREAEVNKKEILGFAQDNSKLVKEELAEILSGQRGWQEEVKSLLSSKKAAERELAIRVMLRWQGESEDYKEVFSTALEKEKNGKVRELLEKALNLEGEGSSGAKMLSLEDLVKEIHKGGKKRSLAWAYEAPFSVVHRAGGQEAGEDYLQAVLLCYAVVDGCGVSTKAAMLAEDLNREEFAVYVNELFDKWMEAGAEAKKRWVLYAASIHGGFEIIKRLQHQVQEWPQQARGAIAAEAVKALSLNPLPQALLIVDGISRKFKFKQVKAAAGQALEFAAAQLGISREELADRIVPDLGFDGNGERSFDYGERKFRVAITPALEIEVYDESGKKLKNMPSPGKRDDEKKAAAAYEEFKQMKKQMKMTVSSQKMRLELALSSGRKWGTEAWEQLFVKNPVMHQFAIGLVWGIYEGEELLQNFRYMEDGSFNTEDEEEYELPQEGRIGLVHPIELSRESLEVWKQQLEDYEIRQPIEQLERAVYARTEEEGEGKNLERFGGMILNDLSFGGKLQTAGWYRGPVEDGGCFNTYYRVDEDAGIGAQISFSGSFVGGENEDITVYEGEFYPAETLKKGYVYSDEDKAKAFLLKDVPERYFSEIVLQLTKATASSQERNEDWRKETG